MADYADRGLLVVAFRADHLGEVSAFPAVARLVERNLHLVTPMAEDGLRAVTERPAVQAGLLLEPGLVDLLIREVEGEPGDLPLLSHALRRTWLRREGPLGESFKVLRVQARQLEVLMEQTPTRSVNRLRLLLAVVPGDVYLADSARAGEQAGSGVARLGFNAVGQ